MRASLSHGVIALLFAAGLTLPMLGALDVMGYAWTAVLILLGMTATLTVASMNRIALIVTSGLMSVGAAVWLALLGGLSLTEQVLRAVTLHLAGQTAVLPLYAMETAMLLTVLIGAAAWLLTVRGVGGYPALAVLLLVVLMLWLSDMPGLMVYALPGVAAVVTLLVMGGHEELSIRRALPVAVVAVVVSYLLVPSGGVTSPTLKGAADDLRQRIYDYLFYTEPRNVFSLSTEGYYPQGQTQLGGKAEPTEHAVLLVSTPRRVYLRGTVKDEYTGRTWRDTTGGRRYLWVSPRWTGQREDVFNMSLPKGLLGESNGLMLTQEVRVQMLADNVSTMFVPQRVRNLSPGGDLVPYFNNASEIFATRDLQSGDTYTVSAPLMLAGDAGLGTLISACAGTEDAYYDEVLKLYTQLPAHLQDPVYDIARRAAEGAATPYEQAFAIQNYLSRNFHYTLDVAAQPENMDFVTNFLINTKEGYCTYFASAMTVLCRMVGLPARYVEGYIASPDENGLAYVTGLQAHAWTEVYFAGFGWLTFDATPVQNNSVTPPDQEKGDGENSPEPEDAPTPTPPPDSDQASTPPEESPSPEPSDSPEDDNQPTPTPDPEAPNQEPPRENPPMSLWWLWLLLALLTVAGIALRVLLTTPEKRAARCTEPNALFLSWVQAVHDALRVMGLPPNKSESPMAYMKRLDALHTLPATLTPLGECMALVFYGKLTPEPEEIDMAREACQQLKRVMTVPQKLRFFAERAFIPAKKTDFTKR